MSHTDHGVRALAMRLIGLLLLCVSSTAFADTTTAFDGKALFNTHCAICHRATGAGTPGLAPPLTNVPAAFIATPDGRRQLAITLLYGMYGDITVDDRHYNFKMPEFSRLDDQTLATLINYVSHELAHASETDFLTISDLAAERMHPIEGAAVHAHRSIALAAHRP